MAGDLKVPNLEATGDVQLTSLNAGAISGVRNFILNGELEIWERAPGAKTEVAGTEVPFSSGTAGKWFADRWHVPNNANYTDFSWSKGTFENRISGLRNFANLARTAGSLNALQVMAAIENPKFTLGTVLTLSMWVPAGAAPNLVQIYQRVGSFGSATLSATVGAGKVIDTVNTGSTGTWKRYSYLVTTTAEPQSSVLEVRFNVPVPGGVAKFAGVQLELGPIATQNQYPEIGSLLTGCQRFYQSSVNRGWYSTSVANYGNAALVSFTFTNVADFYTMQFKTQMGSPPTVSVRNVARDGAKARRTGGAIDSQDVVVNTVGPEGFEFTLGGGSAGRTYALAWNAYAEL